MDCKGTASFMGSERFEKNELKETEKININERFFCSR